MQNRQKIFDQTKSENYDNQFCAQCKVSHDKNSNRGINLRCITAGPLFPKISECNF